ncbi:hypothetical protein RND81_09G206200 [Saponaria officinalis]|uniref:AP2/ERF domain-containing protein n=1 Tax=Saponaria officinalis TaxID=3572 RepID=A0AAW1INY5_SAPOF
MKRKAVHPPSSVIDSSNAASPSSPSPSSSSSSSSCVVDCHNNNNNRDNQENVHEEDLKPLNKPKKIRKRKSINGISNDKCPVVNPPTNRRSSIYRGVTRHRWTGRFEAHLWDKSSWNSIQNKKGRQVYLGAYDSELDAARTYDLAALKYWGPDTTLNFPVKNYTKELEEMQNVSKEEYLASLRRRSSGFSRGVSKYRGVARHHHNGRWEARIGRVFGNKYLYLGTFSSQEEAAAAYDLAAIEYRGANAVTNFDISNYIGRIKNVVPKSESLPIPVSKKAKQPQQQLIQSKKQQMLEEDQEVKPPDLQQAQPEEKIALPSQFDKSKLASSMDHSSMLEMDGPEDDRENPWGFCLEMGGYDHPHLVPDIPLEEDGKLLDLFNQTGFEDNIDMIFEGEGNFISLDDTYIDGGGCKSVITTSEDLDKVEKLPKMENLISFYTPSPPSSTASLVSC